MTSIYLPSPYLLKLKDKHCWKNSQIFFNTMIFLKIKKLWRLTIWLEIKNIQVNMSLGKLRCIFTNLLVSQMMYPWKSGKKYIYMSLLWGKMFREQFKRGLLWYRFLRVGRSSQFIECIKYDEVEKLPTSSEPKQLQIKNNVILWRLIASNFKYLTTKRKNMTFALLHTFCLLSIGN